MGTPDGVPTLVLGHFHGTYLRTTRAVAEEIRVGFPRPDWVERWDVEFGELYLKPFEAWNRGDPVPGPWTVAFETARIASTCPDSGTSCSASTST